MRIAKAEVVWLLRWSAVALLVATLPYLLGYLWTPPGGEFLGLLPYAADGHTYLAKMLQGANGEWLYHLAFTSEDHQGALIFTFYLALGHLARALGMPLGLPLVAVLHVARLVFGLAMLVVAYLFIARFTDKLILRRVAFLLVAFSGGTGWLFFFLTVPQRLDDIPVDVHLPDATSFWALYTFPHFTLSVTLMLLIFLCMLEAYARRSWGHAVAAGLAGAILGLTHPSILVVYAVLGAYLAFLWWARRRFPRQEAAYTVLMGALSAPPVLYEYTTILTNWAFRAWNEQNYCYSPDVLNLLSAFGLSLAIAILGVRYIWRSSSSCALSATKDENGDGHNNEGGNNRIRSFPNSLLCGRGGYFQVSDTERMLPALWGLMVPILMYIPTSVQRRLMEGWHVVLSLLIAFGLVGWVLPRLGRLLRVGPAQRARRRATLLNVLLILLIPSNLLLISVGVTLVLRRERPLYLYPGQVEALAWLRANTASPEVILTGFDLGNIIPGQTGNRVVYGHWPETLYADRKAQEIQTFFNGATPTESRLEFLQRYRVRYLWYGYEERGVGAFDPAAASYLRPVFTRPEVIIYQVVLP